MATSVRLAPETEQILDYLAAHTGRTKASYLHEIIKQGIHGMEDYYLAADVLERVRKGQEQVHSAASHRKICVATLPTHELATIVSNSFC